jgi:hypothetical protein
MRSADDAKVGDLWLLGEYEWDTLSFHIIGHRVAIHWQDRHAFTCLADGSQQGHRGCCLSGMSLGVAMCGQPQGQPGDLNQLPPQH